MNHLKLSIAPIFTQIFHTVHLSESLDTNNTKIDEAQKQALRIAFNDYQESLIELLDIAAGTTIHTEHQ